MDGWIEIKDCPYCRDELTPYKTAISAPAMLVSFCNGSLPMLASVMYCRCKTCGLVVQSPRMTDERIEYYYSSGTYRATLGINAEAMDADEERRAVSVAHWLKLQGVYPDSHLDIGASRGYLLQNMGARVRHGFDNNPSYSDIMQIYNRREDLHFYDLVSSVHCLEHVTDPVSELQWYKSLASDLLYVEVPGENAMGGALRFAHLFYFPPQLLRDMLESIGMKILNMETEPNTRILCKKNVL